MTASEHSVVFMGTPEFAVPSLCALIEAGYPVKGVFTQPDRPVGRGQGMAAPPVKRVALERGIPVHQPQRLRADADAHAALEAIAPDLIVVVAYGQILPESILSLPRHGCLNVHASLLPCYRGAAPIQWSVIHGDLETGVTTMLMEKGLDTGPMLLSERTAIGPEETSDALSKRLSALGAKVLLRTLEPWIHGELQPIKQDDSAASYAPMLKKEHSAIDWSLSARELCNRIRGLHPWPGSITTLSGQPIKILRAAIVASPPAAALPGTIVALGDRGWDVACGDGSVTIEWVQLPGKKPQEAAAVARGWRELQVGARLGAWTCVETSAPER